MYLTKNYLNDVLENILKESVGLLNELTDLSHEYNLDDFDPNEKKSEEIKKRLSELNKIIEGINNYMKLI